MPSRDWVALDVQVVRRETEKAFQVILKGGRIVWLPKGQVQGAALVAAGLRDCIVYVSAWLYQQKREEGAL